MKISINLIMSAFIYIYAATSCTTTEKFYLQSSVDAAIILPMKSSTEYSQIEKGNSIKVEVPSDSYVGYITIKDKDKNIDIPVGINTHRNKRTSSKASVIGCIIPPLCAWAIVESSRHDQLSYNGQFSYDKYQRAAVDGLLTTLLRQDPPKNTVNASSHSKKKKYASSGVKTSTSKTSKAKIKNRNLASFVVGSYQCSGNLMDGNSTDEEYPSVQIVIKQVDKTNVSVEVIESGESIFESPMEYTVKANGKNNYLLTLHGVPEATIEITKTGKITFLHKRVNINGDIYTLSIKGNKNR